MINRKILVTNLFALNMVLVAHPVRITRILNASGYGGYLQLPNGEKVSFFPYENREINGECEVKEGQPFGECVIKIPHSQSVHQSLSAHPNADTIEETITLKLDKTGLLRIVTTNITAPENNDGDEWGMVDITQSNQECVLLLRKTPDIDPVNRQECIREEIRALRRTDPDMTASMEEQLGIHALEEALREYNNLNNVVIETYKES